MASTLFAEAQYEVYLHNYAHLSTTTTTNVSDNRIKVSDKVLQLAAMLDKLAVMGCLVFSELPAHNKVVTLFWIYCMV